MKQFMVAVAIGFPLLAEVPSEWATLGAALIVPGTLVGSRRLG